MLPLHHLIYQSQATEAFSVAQLREQLVRYRHFNAAHGLTGILLYMPNGQLMQLLEGETQTVASLFYDRIVHDARHFDIRVLSEGPWARRSFPAWTMAFVAPEPDNLQAETGFQELSALRELLPRLAPGRPGLVHLLLEFIEQHENPPKRFR